MDLGFFFFSLIIHWDEEGSRVFDGQDLVDEIGEVGMSKEKAIERALFISIWDFGIFVRSFLFFFVFSSYLCYFLGWWSFVVLLPSIGDVDKRLPCGFPSPAFLHFFPHSFPFLSFPPLQQNARRLEREQCLNWKLWRGGNPEMWRRRGRTRC